MNSILDRLRDPSPVLLDGATGTELSRRGVNTSLPLWSARALVDAPDVLRQIHREYVEAGAEVITANTFRTHARTLAHAGMQKRAAELTKLAVSIARDAADDRVWVAGSQSPLEDCYTPGLVPDDAALDREHHLMAENLAEAGVDLILAETQNTVREAVATCRAAAATGVPSFVSLVCGTDSRLLSGETITSAVEAVRPFSPVALLLNCLPADSALKPLRGLQAAADGIPVGIYANVGRPNAAQGWVNTDAVDPQAYSRYAADWLSAGAKLIGGCCGTTPEHIRALKRLIRRETGSG